MKSTPSRQFLKIPFAAGKNLSLKRVLAFALPAALILPLGNVPAASGTVPLERGLESVDVSLRSDGSIEDISASHTQLMLQDETIEAATSAYSFSPQEDAERLPVRILTSYSTDETSGNNLSDLNGTSGKIRIDLQVHNLTVNPQEVSFDANGRAIKRRELVGAPLTVVASTTLKGDPSQVMTAELPGGDEQTNGVISKDSEGNTVVQWAAILAPPVLDATAEFSLVADVEDFELPNFDISVQPGILTDSSMQGLIDAAFKPNETSEAKLTARTISVLSQARDVLAESGESLSEVRQLLETSADNIGTRTISDLKSSNEHVLASTRNLSSTLNGLNSALGGELKTTDSAVVSGLSTTVQ
ncbi:MAG: hypothetical protein CSA82_02255 [Actinobacteria bacterium]|nr:MAG: hypothetical protein CSA82_02255 [Actinomycetota bacterium]